ncbi:hypothetical protein [Ancylobacter amanitiformis]|uniref:Uncharacterized protein n=1 Tax=Ancylobacter amanitiformis TaxID=217069 RepID=A0ABU0LKW8_9HYPH|nr:hypothetical protein [Ancylobacter amanitiformis]MDQ0509341.1 hypothetical protein [Ancylobacter amanitiformis]
MTDDERRALLDRITELNRGDRYLADLCGMADGESLLALVAEMERATAAVRGPGGRLADIWRQDNALLIKRK